MSRTGSVSFTEELKRRKVGRVALAYLGVALAVLEVADKVVAALFIDERLYGVMVIAAVAGLPVVLGLAWLFDLTAAGIELTPPTTGEGTAGSEGVGRSDRFTRQLVVASAVVVLAMTGIGWRYMPTDEVELIEDKVAVASFENLTGDPARDVDGIIVMKEVARTLGRVEGLTVVSFDEVSLPGAAGPDAVESTRSPSQALAESAHAGLVVRGSYHLAGDSLVYQAEVLDARKREIIYASAPVAADPANPTLVFPRLLGDLLGFMGGMAGSLATGETAPVLQASGAPTYAAYQQYALGIELYVRPAQKARALALLDSAARLDTTFVRAMLAASLLRDRSAAAEAEPYLSRLESMRAELAPYERAQLDMTQARMNGDLQAVYRAAAEVAELIGTSNAHWLAGDAALKVNRPNEAIEHFLQYDRERSPHPQLWMSLAQAYHRAGKHRRELRIARLGLDRYPYGFMKRVEMEARAARGQGDVVLADWSGADWNNMGTRFSMHVAEELEAHGDAERARELRERLLERERQAPPEQSGSVQGQREQAELLWALNRDEEAGVIYRALLAADPESVGARVGAALVAARTGDRDGAEATLEWLEERTGPRPDGLMARNQARIAGALGSAERAVRLLKLAEDRGSDYFERLHTDPAFETIRQHPTFTTYLKPRG